MGNSLNPAAAQIFLDPLLAGRRGAGEHLRTELPSELPIMTGIVKPAFLAFYRRSRYPHDWQHEDVSPREQVASTVNTVLVARDIEDGCHRHRPTVVKLTV